MAKYDPYRNPNMNNKDHQVGLLIMLLVTSGVIWGDLRTYWSDFSDFRMQNHSMLLNVLSDL